MPCILYDNAYVGITSKVDRELNLSNRRYINGINRETSQITGAIRTIDGKARTSLVDWPEVGSRVPQAAN